MNEQADGMMMMMTMLHFARYYSVNGNSMPICRAAITALKRAHGCPFVHCGEALLMLIRQAIQCPRNLVTSAGAHYDASFGYVVNQTCCLIHGVRYLKT